MPLFDSIWALPALPGPWIIEHEKKEQRKKEQKRERNPHVRVPVPDPSHWPEHAPSAEDESSTQRGVVIIER